MFHNFLKHYSDRKTKPFEERPIKIKNLEILRLLKLQMKVMENFMILAIQKKP